MKTETTDEALGPAVVVGGCGSVGRMLARLLADRGLPVNTIDRERLSEADSFGGAHLIGDIRFPDQAMKEQLRSAGLVVVCLPAATVSAAYRLLLDQMLPGSLWVDTLSVKTGICRELQEANTRIEILSVNPMCSPALGLNNQNVAVVEVAPGPRARCFLQLLSTWGAKLVSLSAEEHDRTAAAIQAATHAAILAFGLALKEMRCDPSKASRMSTPPHRTLVALLERITSGAPETYWDVQAGNPYAREAREQLLAGLRKLHETVNGGEFDRFRDMLDDLLAVFGPRTGDRAEAADQTIRWLATD
jgi:4-amino-4-deoxyprephenate dehydrogenase